MPIWAGLVLFSRTYGLYLKGLVYDIISIETNTHIGDSKMGLKAKLQKIENSKKNQDTKDTKQVTWLEGVYGKNKRYAASKVYSK